MASILQGTTPVLEIPFSDSGFSVTDISEAQLTFRISGSVYTHTLSELEVDESGETLLYHFGERETMAFAAGETLTWQLYVKVNGEVYGTKESALGIIEKIKGAIM